MKTRANGKPGRWGSFLLFFTSGIAIGVATAQAEPLATQTLTLKPGWNAAYYDAFTAYHKDGDLLPMLGIFAERERQRLLDHIAAIG